MGQPRAELTVFISSPSDLSKERTAALGVIERLNERPRVGGRFRLQALEYKRATPAVVGESAQSVVDSYMARAADCHIFVCMLWTRMGTPVIDVTTGEQFESGTHYEFTRAYDAYQRTKRQPRLLLYKCKRSLPIDVDLKQVEKVRSFFERFNKTPPDLEGMIKPFEEVDEFEQELFDDLDTVLSKDFATADSDDSVERPASTAQETAARRRYLEILSSDVDNRLRTSIHGAQLLDVAADESLDTTTLPWEYQAKDDPSAFTSIDDVFSAFRGRFLLLGGPGSGKTTTLLCIARRLLSEAMEDPASPIPLLFNLSKFATFARTHERRLRSLVEKKHTEEEADRAVIEDWLTLLLAEYPGITTPIARRWIAEDRVALLLDGLDELDDEWLERLAVSLNRTYLRGHPDTIVIVCSRILEYDPLKRKEETRLNLRGAATLKPLTREQIDAYLEKAGAAGLKAALIGDAALEELAQVPLTLSMMTLAYGGLSPEAIPADLSLTERRRHLFDAYVDRMMQRKARRDAGKPFDLRTERDLPTEYSRAEINRRLGWLAVRLSERMQTVFPYRQLHAFLAQNRRSVWLSEGVYTAMCAGIALGPMMLTGLRPHFFGVLVGAAALSPVLATEAAGRVARAISSGLWAIAFVVLFVGGFGLLNASLLSFVPPTTSPYVSGLALLTVLTAVFYTLILAEDRSRRRVLTHIVLSVLGPLVAIALTLAAGWQVRQVAWAAVGVLGATQLAQIFRQMREEESETSDYLIALSVTVGICASTLAAVRVVESPRILHVAVTIVLAVATFAVDELKPAAMVATAVAAGIGAFAFGPPGAVVFACVTMIAALNLPLAAADGFIRRTVLGKFVGMEALIGSIPPRLHNLLRYSVAALLLKDVGHEYEFVHRLLRDHFATRELTPKLRVGALSDQLRAIGQLSRHGEAAIEPLAALLESASVEVRIAATTALARIAVPTVTPFLLKAARDPLPEVRRRLVIAVAKMSDEIAHPVLKAGVSDADATVRDAAIRAVSKLQEYNQKDILAHAFARESPEVERQVLRLWPADYGAIDPVPPRLLGYLEDTESRVRLGAIVACGHESTKAPPHVIRNLLFDEDAVVRETILKVASFSREAFLDDLLRLCHDPLKGTHAPRDVRAWWRRRSVSANISAAVITGFKYNPTDDDRVSELVRNAIRDRRTVVRVAAIRALPLHGDSRKHEVLRSLLHDPTDSIRAAAIDGLDFLGDQLAIPDVLPLLRSRTAAVRAAAARFVGDMQFEPAVPQLIPMLEDSDFLVRLYACVALRTMSDPIARAALRSFLTRDDVPLSRRVDIALSIGEQRDEQAVTWLKSNLGQFDMYTRQRAERLLAEDNEPTIGSSEAAVTDI